MHLIQGAEGGDHIGSMGLSGSVLYLGPLGDHFAYFDSAGFLGKSRLAHDHTWDNGCVYRHVGTRDAKLALPCSCPSPLATGFLAGHGHPGFHNTGHLSPDVAHGRFRAAGRTGAAGGDLYGLRHGAPAVFEYAARLAHNFLAAFCFGRSKFRAI